MDSDEPSLVFDLVREHFERTASRRAEAILNLWDVYRGQFWKVAPKPAAAPPPVPEPVVALVTERTDVHIQAEAPAH